MSGKKECLYVWVLANGIRNLSVWPRAPTDVMWSSVGGMAMRPWAILYSRMTLHCALLTARGCHCSVLIIDVTLLYVE